MFRLIKLFFMILLINDKIFSQLVDELPVTNPTINLTDIDTSTLFSGFFTVNNVPECPGTCIHAIASMFCDEILDHVFCESKLFRCCAVFNNSTLVETSPPLEELTTLTPINEFAQNNPSSTVHSSELTNSPLPNVTKATSYLYHTSTPASSFTTIVQKFTPKCTGICMENRLSKYCGNILVTTTPGLCDINEFCCLQSNQTIITTTLNVPSSTESTVDSIDLNSSSSSNIIDTTTITTTNRQTTSTSTSVEASTASNLNQTQNSSEKKILSDEETFKNTNETVLENENKHDKNSDETSSQQASDLPACANCVTLIFTFLCDEIDDTKYCPNGGKCCKYYDTKDEPKNQQSTTQVTNSNQIGKCPGTCIPTILSGICSKPSEIIFKTTTCITGMLCCYTPTDQGDQFNATGDKLSSADKPSLLDNSDDLTFIEPSEQTLNTKLTQFNQPPSTGNGYYQIVPRPHQLIPNQFTASFHQSTSPPLISSHNWPFNQHHLQKIPIYKPLLSNSQMIPSYLSTNGLTNALANSLSNGRPNYILNSLNNFNNRSPPLFYPPSTNAHSPSTADLLNNLNVHLANAHLTNNVLPSVPAFKLNSTSNLISHFLIANNIPPTSCTGTCIPSIFKFTCFGPNTIYTNFVCNKPQQMCCASNQDIETYESTILPGILGSLSNETNLINNLVHSNYFANLMPTTGNLASAISTNIASNSLNNNLANSMSGVSSNLPLNSKPASNAMNIIKNGNLANKINKNYGSNKVQPINRIGNKENSLTDKFIELNQPTVSAASNVNRNRYYPSNNVNKNSHKLTPLINTSKWSNSLSSPSNLSSSHFTPVTPITNLDRMKKPDQSTSFSPIIEHRPTVELATTSTKLPVCGLTNDIAHVANSDQNLKWCWQVALVNQENQYICSGALIGTSWVLTAANCISKLVQNAEPIFVRVGESDLMASNSNIFKSDTQKANTTYIHHNHNGETLENDIALIKLQRPLQLKSNICLICLPARGSTVQSGKRCTATGYNSESSFERKMKESSQPILNEYQCSKKFSSLTNRSFILPTSSFCAGGEEDETCDDIDLGGPLACPDEDGYYELAGLMSYSFDCKVPNIYVKVANFIGWINQIISVNN